MTKTRVKFSKAKAKKEMLAVAVKIQTERLAAYASKETNSIGDDISVAPTRNGLDRTGNLLDSLCWGVCHDGKVKEYGYYRPAEAIEDSNLHEYSRPMGDSVNGHFLASQFIATYNPSESKGWEMFIAILAPYWGYWEKGFVHKPSSRFFQWQVMTRHYDVVSQDLSPARVTFNTYIPE